MSSYDKQGLSFMIYVRFSGVITMILAAFSTSASKFDRLILSKPSFFQEFIV